MARGRVITKTIILEECNVGTAAIEFYRHNKAKGLTDKTQEAYKYYVNAFVKYLGSETCLTDVSVKEVDAYMYEKLDSKANTVTVATAMVHLRRFFKWCASRDYMEKIEVTIPKFEKEQKEPYTEEEMLILLRKPLGKNWVEYRSWVMINYFFSTGQRLSSVLNIKVEHLDLENHRVWLVHNKDKIKKWMPLSTALVKILKEYIDASALTMEDYLFPEYEGGQLKIRSAEDSIAKYNRARGVYKTSIHLFRHTFAKNYIMNGGNPVKLQKLLNHKTMEMTMNYVNLYATDISSDLDLYNPLDSFKRNHITRR